MTEITVKTRYTIKSKEEAQIAYNRIVSLSQDRKYHSVTTKAVVADARQPSSPLHKYFEWNNGRAAARFRLEQARDLLQAVYITVQVKGGAVTVRAFEAVVRPGSGDRVFAPHEAVKNNPNLRLQAVRAVLSLMESCVDKCRDYEETLPIAQVFDKVKARVVKRLK